MSDISISPFQAALAAVFALTLCATMFADEEQVVLLHNGNVFQGEVEKEASHVVVHSARSHIRLAKSDVLMVTDDLATAFLRQAKTISRSNLADRVRLIQWCLRNDLRAEASEQLDILKSTSPDHPQIPLLSERISHHRPTRSTAELPAQHALPPDRRYFQQLQSKLSKNSMSTYVRNIQPLLVNRCAQAGCHGRAAENPYHISLSSRSASRAFTEANLGATLQRIGPYAPEQTLLWMSAETAHGTLRKRPLSRSEFDSLGDWIEEVVQELHGQELTKPDPHVVLASAETLDETVDPFDPGPFNALNDDENGRSDIDVDPDGTDSGSP